MVEVEGCRGTVGSQRPWREHKSNVKYIVKGGKVRQAFLRAGGGTRAQLFFGTAAYKGGVLGYSTVLCEEMLCGWANHRF